MDVLSLVRPLQFVYFLALVLLGGSVRGGGAWWRRLGKDGKLPDETYRGPAPTVRVRTETVPWGEEKE